MIVHQADNSEPQRTRFGVSEVAASQEQAGYEAEKQPAYVERIHWTGNIAPASGAGKRIGAGSFSLHHFSRLQQWTR